MVWQYEKFFGDNDVIYAFCPKCGFHHNPSKMIKDGENHWSIHIQYQYGYCPACGEYLYDDDEVVTWEKVYVSSIEFLSKRDIEELLHRGESKE